MAKKKPGTIKALEKGNEELKRELEETKKHLKSLEVRLEESSSQNGQNGGPCPARETLVEAEKSLVFLGEEYDDLNRSEQATRRELSDIDQRLNVMDKKLNELEKTLEDFVEYSYGSNVKLLGLPELSSTEEAHETSSLCVKLFNALGATSVSISDIDIAHRVPTRVARDGPKPVICKFTRRLARNAVMAVRREISSVSPTDLGLPRDEDLSHTRIVDHLSPKRQQLYTDAKNFKSATTSTIAG